jgi:hypothetical protein
MQYWSAFTAALVGLLLLASLTLLRRGPVDEVRNHAQPANSVPAATQDIALQSDALADKTDAAQDAMRIDLRSASQSFRNSTLVFAIRRAGFYCADVVSAHESADGVWVASCSDMLGYIVASRAAEQFDVHPVAQYFDGVAPVPIDRDRLLEPRLLEPRSLQPEPLR